MKKIIVVESVMFLRSVGRSLRFSSQLRVGAMRTGARRMCTAVAEEAAEISPFSPTIPHNQMFYASAFITYVFAIKWQMGDKKLAKDIAAAKAAYAEAHPEEVAAAAAAAESVAAAVTPSVVSAVVPAAVASAASPATWKVADVAAWLDTIELSMHSDSFKTHSVNGKMLLALSDQDLYATLGVVSPLHRKKLLMEISALRKSYLAK